MEQDFNYIKIKIFFKDNLIRENNKEKENLCGLVDNDIKDNGKMDISMEMVFLMVKIIKNTLVNLNLINRMAKEFINLITEINIKDNGNKD